MRVLCWHIWRYRQFHLCEACFSKQHPFYARKKDAHEVPENRHVLEGVGDLSAEDSGQALIVEVDDGVDENEGWFVRVQSWNETLHDEAAPKQERFAHPKWVRELHGRRIRVTVEVLD